MMAPRDPKDGFLDTERDMESYTTFAALRALKRIAHQFFVVDLLRGIR